VRWDGDHERHEFVVGELAERAELVPICPELEIGLGVPREAIQLVRRDDGFDLFGVASKRDLTRTMRTWCRRKIAELAELDPDAFVLKSRSPSCGIDGARVFETKADLLAEDGPWTRSGRGLFASAVLEAFPDRPVVDETQLDTPEKRRRFLADLISAREARGGRRRL
jgi:uncharacterized protein YbbK (DUF523 family)